MKVLIALDKFKGSATAAEVCEAVVSGIAPIFPDAEPILTPIADGGEGTTEALATAMGGSWVELEVTDPHGRPRLARYAVVTSAIGATTAVMEMSAASGFEIVTDLPADPWRASTYGTGQLIAHAAAAGVDKILIGIGGSATNDGGSGMATALGAVFRNQSGEPIFKIPSDAMEATTLDTSNMIALPEIVVACDVTNPLLGANGATPIYGPQKGVQPEDFPRHEDRLRHLADLIESGIRKQLREDPGTGAAGGLGFGLYALCDAKLEPGFDLVADVLGLDKLVADADLIITGEGRIDLQTASGKGPGSLARLAREHGKPVIGICGACEDGAEDAFDLVIAAKPPEMPLEDAIAAGASLIAPAINKSSDLLRQAVGV